MFSFTDYVTALQAKRICLNRTKDGKHSKHLRHLHFDISGMPDNSRNWQVPFIQCDSRLCTRHGEEAYQYCQHPKLGIAANNKSDIGGMQRASDFQNYIYKRYPQLSNTSLPALQHGEFIRLFESNNALEKYTTHPDYGIGSDRPRLAMAVVFSGNDNSSYDYTIRINSTNNNAPGWSNGMSRTTPDTNRLFSSLAKREYDACGHIVHGSPQGPLQFSCTGQYILNGLLPMQRFLHDWIMVDSGAHDNGLFVAEHGVKFISFPTKRFEEKGFYTLLNGKWIPLSTIQLTIAVIYIPTDHYCSLSWKPN